jgi:hypothetical protein
MRLITVSASYGAGGSVVGPAVARRLDLPFLDRAVPASGSDRPEAVSEGATPGEDLSRSLWQRIFDGFAATPPEVVGEVTPLMSGDAGHRVRVEAERRLHAFADEGGGVVLGWAGAVALPEAFRVRLDGPIEGRVRNGMAIEGLDEESVRRRLARSDEVRRVYWRRLYRQDWRDPDWYHLWIDTTVIDFDAAADLIERGARAAWGEA